MSIFSRILKPKIYVVDKSATNWNIFKDIFDNSDNVMKDYSKVGDPYETNGIVYAAINRKVASFAKADFQILDYKGKVQDDSNPFVRLFDNPYPQVSKFLLWEELISNLELYGKAFWVNESFLYGRPSMMFIANSSMMKIVKTKQGGIAKYVYGNKNSEITYSPEQVIFFKYWHPRDPLDGMAPITAARTDILQNYYADQYNTKFFKQGGLVKGYFQNSAPRKMGRQQEKELSESITKNTAGLENAHKTPVLQKGLTFKTIGIPQKDMEFLESKKYNRDQILAIFQVPSSLFYNDSSHSNVRELRRDFFTNTIIPLIKKIQQQLKTDFFDRYNIPYRGVFNIKDVPELQKEMKDQADVAYKFYNMGVPFNVINEKLGLGFPPVKDGDEPKPARIVQPAKENKEGIIKQHEKKQLIAKEKSLTFDKVLRLMEQGKAAKVMNEYEKPMISKIKKFWKSKFKEAIALLKVKDKADSLTSEIVAQIITTIKGFEWDKQFVETLTPDIEKIFMKGAERSITGVGMAFNLPNTEAATFIANRGLKLKASTEIVKQTLIDALAKPAGYTTDILAKTISKVFDVAEGRAKNIARTETTIGYNGGRLDGMKKVGIKKKQWINSGDRTVRPSHQIEQIVGVDEYFILADGESVMYPGDGSAANSCNCRCSIISVLFSDDEERLLQGE